MLSRFNFQRIPKILQHQSGQIIPKRLTFSKAGNGPSYDGWTSKEGGSKMAVALLGVVAGTSSAIGINC